MADAPECKARRRCLHLTPDRAVLGLLAVEGFLWLSGWFRWFPFNEHKGWTVLIAVAGVGVFLLLMLLWFVVSLIFHWRFQYSIRSLLLLVVAVALPFSWLAVAREGARMQREAVKGIKEVGGDVSYDWQVDANGLLLANGQPPGPQWLQNLLGTDFFTIAVRADISVPVQRINPPPFATVGLEYLPWLPQLRWLQINDTKLTATEVQYLKGLNQLRELNLLYVQVTDDGLEELGQLTQLQNLKFFGTDISNIGLAHLRTLIRLQSLRLYNTQITDDGLANLEGMTHLRFLDLQWTSLSDSGLQHLKGLLELESLNIHATKVSDAGVRKLQKALPKLKIER